MEKLNRHALIQEEFRAIFDHEPYRIPTHTDGILILSAGPEIDANRQIITEHSEENIARITLAVELMKKIAAKKAGVEVENLTRDQLYYFGTPLILDGETEQLPMMREVAMSLGIEAEYIEDLDCGKRGVANTKTNMEAFNSDPRFKDFKHVTVVTSDFHTPRVYRTAEKNLRTDLSFDIVSVPHQQFSNDPKYIYRVVRGEVQRIQTYVAKGDISSKPMPVKN